jgi:hypothetical protein
MRIDLSGAPLEIPDGIRVYPNSAVISKSPHYISLCPLWVGSGPSPSYQLKVRYRAQTGRSATTFQKSKSERLLFPEADVQISSNPLLSTAANGQKQT